MKILAELEIRDDVKLVLQRGDYKGSERIDLRQYYKRDGEYIPTKRGISFSSEWEEKFVEMIEKLKDE